MKLKDLRQQNAELKQICIELHWMARRYADGRRTFSANVLNQCVRTLVAMGVKLKGDPIDNGTVYARDGDPKLCEDEEHFASGNPICEGHYLGFPHGTSLPEELLKELGGKGLVEAIKYIQDLKKIASKHV